MSAPAVKRLRQLFRVDGARLVRRIDAGNAKAGDVAGTDNGKGYLLVSVDGARHKVHRVIYALTYGVWPTGEVDHIDGDRRNNDPANLRVATRSQNMQNRKGAGSLSALGLMGVSSAAKQNCPGYKYTITVNGKRTVKYGFATPEEAHAAYLAAKREVHPFAQAVFK